MLIIYSGLISFGLSDCTVFYTQICLFDLISALLCSKLFVIIYENYNISFDSALKLTESIIRYSTWIPKDHLNANTIGMFFHWFSDTLHLAPCGMIIMWNNIIMFQCYSIEFSALVESQTQSLEQNHRWNTNYLLEFRFKQNQKCKRTTFVWIPFWCLFRLCVWIPCCVFYNELSNAWRIIYIL